MIVDTRISSQWCFADTCIRFLVHYGAVVEQTYSQVWGGCIYNKCNILPIIQKKSINKDLLSGFILPAVTTDAVWFTVGSFVCLLSPVNTIVTRWVHVSRVTCLSITRVTRVQVRDQPRRVRGRDRPHLLRARAVLGGECPGSRVSVTRVSV